MTTFEITGMTCGGCVKRVQAKLEAVAPGVQVQLKPPQATLPGPMDVATLQAALAGSHYSITAPAVVEPPPAPPAIAPNWFATYRPLLLIVAYILGASLLLQGAQVSAMGTMHYFMAGFFLVFSFFKLLNLKDFAESYAMYDVVAKKV